MRNSNNHISKYMMLVRVQVLIYEYFCRDKFSLGSRHFPHDVNEMKVKKEAATAAQVNNCYIIDSTFCTRSSNELCFLLALRWEKIMEREEN